MSKFIREYQPGGKRVRHTHTLSVEECQKMVGGYIAVYFVNGLNIVCDEEGKLKGKSPCLHINGNTYVGNLLVGVFTDNGLEPATEKQQKEFERLIGSYY